MAEVRNSLKIEWYRCPIDAATLRALMQRSDLQGLLQAGGHLLLFSPPARSGSIAPFCAYLV